MASAYLRSTCQQSGSTKYPRNSSLCCWKDLISRVWHGATAASDSGLPWHSLCACWVLENMKLLRIPLHSYQADCAAQYAQNHGRWSEHRRDPTVPQDPHSVCLYLVQKALFCSFPSSMQEVQSFLVWRLLLIIQNRLFQCRGSSGTYLEGTSLPMGMRSTQSSWGTERAIRHILPYCPAKVLAGISLWKQMSLRYRGHTVS